MSFGRRWYFAAALFGVGILGILGVSGEVAIAVMFILAIILSGLHERLGYQYYLFSKKDSYFSNAIVDFDGSVSNFLDGTLSHVLFVIALVFGFWFSADTVRLMECDYSISNCESVLPPGK